mgnify:CR=1 FL=1
MKDLTSKLHKVIYILSLLLVFSACSKEEKNEMPSPVIEPPEEEPKEEVAEKYEFTVSISSADYDKPDTTSTDTYNFVYENGKLTEKARKVKGIKIKSRKSRALVGIPIDVITHIDIEGQNLTELASSIPNLSIRISNRPDNVFIESRDLEMNFNPENIPFLQTEEPTVVHRGIDIRQKTFPSELEVMNYDLNIEVLNGPNNVLGSIILPLNETPELPIISTSIVKKSNVNQAEEIVPIFLFTENSDAPNFFNFFHGVGSDGCPMPLFSINCQIGNLLPPDIQSNFLFTFSGFQNSDAINFSNQSSQPPVEIIHNGVPTFFFPPEPNGTFSAEFNFNCVRAADVHTETSLITFYQDGNTFHPVNTMPMPISIEMR